MKPQMIESIGYAGTVVITVSPSERGFHWKALDHGADDLNNIKAGEGNGKTIVEAEQDAESRIEPGFGAITWRR